VRVRTRRMGQPRGVDCRERRVKKEVELPARILGIVTAHSLALPFAFPRNPRLSARSGCQPIPVIRRDLELTTDNSTPIPRHYPGTPTARATMA